MPNHQPITDRSSPTIHRRRRHRGRADDLRARRGKVKPTRVARNLARLHPARQLGPERAGLHQVSLHVAALQTGEC